MKNTLSIIILVVIVIMFSGILLFSEQIDISVEEGRNLATFDIVRNPVTDTDSVLYNEDKSFTERIEAVFKDQFPLRNKVMEKHLEINTKTAQIYDTYWRTKFKLYDILGIQYGIDSNTDKLYPRYGFPRLKVPDKHSYTISKLGDYYRINGSDWLIDRVKTEKIQPSEQDAVLSTLSDIERLQSNYPAMKIYGFFIDQGNDLPWYENYMGTAAVDRSELVAQLAPESIKFSRMYYDDISDYRNLHYKSDHHWGHLGSERGYRIIHNMISEDIEISPVLNAVKEWNFTKSYGIKYKGSRAAKLRTLYDGYDEFIVNEYDVGTRNTYVITPDNLDNEIPVRLTLMEEYRHGYISNEEFYDHYISFYGTAVSLAKNSNGTLNTYSDGKYIFKIDNLDKSSGHNLLIIGDSNMRAVRDPLASHFDTAIYLDYRIMDSVYIDQIIDRYNIDILIIATQGGTIWYKSDKDKYILRFSSGFGQ